MTVWIRDLGLLEVLGRLDDGLVGVRLDGRRDLWARGALRKPATCAATREPLKPGEFAYRPLCHRSRKLRVAANQIESILDRASTGAGGAPVHGRPGRSRSRTPGGGGMADKPATVDTDALEKALLDGVRAKVNGVQFPKAKKAGYARITSDKKTLAYVGRRKRGGLTIDVAQGGGGYAKVKVEEKGAVAGAVDKIVKAAEAAKEPAAA